MKIFTAILITLFVLGAAGWYVQRSRDVVFETQEIQIHNQTFTVEVADTLTKRAQGLQHRTMLEEGKGMLFVFATPSRPPFWMKNTLIPLDFVWIREGKVVELTRNVQPEPDTPDHLLTQYPPSQEIDQMIEFPAGTIDLFHIQVGDVFKE